jgi:hypothetical protein
MRYALIDGTGPIDSVAFAKALKSPSFKNVLESLPRPPPRDPSDPSSTPPFRLDNAKHLTTPAAETRDYLEIGCFLDGLVPGTKGHCNLSPDGVPVLCPNGVNGINNKTSTYPRLQSSFNQVKSEAIAPLFISSPRVGFDSAAFLGTVANPDDCNPALPSVLAADLFYVSSHGFQDGTMMGEDGKAAWWSLGVCWTQRTFFKGPRWIVLAQCSTLNPSMWPFWAYLMRNSDPPIRMILGYEDFSPAATVSATIAKTFVQATLEGKSMLQAWLNPPSGSNPNRAAIVHPRAVNDSLKALADFDAQSSTSSVIPLNTDKYRGYSSEFSGTEITEIAPADYDVQKDVLRLFWLFPGKPLPAPGPLAKGTTVADASANAQNVSVAGLADGVSSREVYISTIGWWTLPKDAQMVFQLNPPDGTRGICLWCTHLRRTWTPQPTLSNVFKAPLSSGASADLYESSGLVGGVSQSRDGRSGYPGRPLLFAVTGTSRVWLVGQVVPQPKTDEHPYFWWAVQFFSDDKCTKAHPATSKPVEFQHKGVWFPYP